MLGHEDPRVEVEAGAGAEVGEGCGEEAAGVVGGEEGEALVGGEGEVAEVVGVLNAPELFAVGGIHRRSLECGEIWRYLPPVRPPSEAGDWCGWIGEWGTE